MIRLAGCVLRNDSGHIGLLHRHLSGFDWWELPGGKVEAGESDEEAAIRELFEELGVTITRTAPLGSALFTYGSREYRYIWYEALEFNGDPTLKEPEVFDEFRYFALPPDPSLTYSPNAKLLFEHLDPTHAQSRGV